MATTSIDRKFRVIFWPVAILIAGLILFPAFTVGYVTYVQHQQNLGWCRLLEDISNGPPPTRVSTPPGPGATEVQKLSYHRWLVYIDIVQLERHYGCLSQAPQSAELPPSGPSS